MAQDRLIKEGAQGTARTPAQNIVPQDAAKLPFETPSYEFYYHNKNGQKTLYVISISYHPGILEVPLEKLAELIAFLRAA
jgi:hypothetical protein